MNGGAIVFEDRLILVSVGFIPNALINKLLECVLWGGAWKCPFQSVSVFVPVVVFSNFLAPFQRVNHDADKEDERSEGNECAVGADFVPVGESFWVVDVTTWHTLATQEVLWEEGQVCADEHHPEVQFRRPFRVVAPRHFTEVEVDAGEDTEDGTKAHHIVEVSHNVVGVVVRAVHASLGQNDARYAADSEEEEEAKRPKHRSFEFNRAAPHGCDP